MGLVPEAERNFLRGRWITAQKLKSVGKKQVSILFEDSNNF